MRSAFVILLFALCVGTALGQEHELMPSLGLRSGGELDTNLDTGDVEFDPGAAFGLAYVRSLGAEKAMEVFWSRESTELESAQTGVLDSGLDVDISYLHVGGVYRPRPDRSMRPFVGFSLGLTHYEPEGGFDSQTELSLAASGGATFRADKRVQLRVLGRWYATLTEATFVGTCGETACRLEVSGSGALQLEGAIGVVFRF